LGDFGFQLNQERLGVDVVIHEIAGFAKVLARD
jgi:hypothetical protein